MLVCASSAAAAILDVVTRYDAANCALLGSRMDERAARWRCGSPTARSSWSYVYVAPLIDMAVHLQ